MPASNRTADIELALVNLAFYERRQISTVCQSVLAKGLTRKQCKNLFASIYDEIPVQDQHEIPSLRRSMGKVKFASLRQTYNVLSDGLELPKHDYTYRVDATKIASSMQFLQSALQLKRGYTRDVTVAGHLFQNIHVSEREGKTCDELFLAYKSAVDSSLTVGNPTFKDILKLLIKLGEVKAGISTYFIRMRDTGRAFTAMIVRVQELLCADKNQKLRKQAKRFITEWKSIERFFTLGICTLSPRFDKHK